MPANPTMILNALNSIEKIEGGYVDNPADKGGPTNKGITLETLARWRGHPVTVDDLKLVQDDEVRQIYTQEYIKGPGFYLIDDNDVFMLVVDCGVNHGVARPTRWLQTALHLTVDGHFGPETARVVNALAPHDAYKVVLAARARFYGSIVSNDATQARFDSGWMDRLAHFIETAP